MYWTVEARNKIVDYLQYGKPSIKATTVVENNISAVVDSEAMEEESTDELVTRGRGTDTFPKEKEEDPVDENSELLGEVVEVEGEHNVEPRL